jgi:hypothetical protein
MNRISIFISSLFLLAASGVSAESKVYVPAPISPAVEDFILQTTGIIPPLSGSKVERPALTPMPTNELQWQRFWDGSQGETGAISNLTLFWSNPNSELLPFSVRLTFEDGALIIQHSNPKDSKLIGGYRLRFDQNRKQGLFVESSNQRSLVVMLPPIINPELRGALVCARDIPADASPYEVPTLMNTKYSVTQIQLHAEGWSRGRFNSGTIEGLAKASVEVGRAAPLPTPSEDIAKIPSPSVSLGYAKLQGAQPEVVDLSNGETFSTGIRTGIELQTLAGHRRARLQSSDIFVKNLKDKSPPNVIYAEIIHPIESGPCVMVVRRNLTRDEFSPPVKPTSESAGSEKDPK